MITPEAAAGAVGAAAGAVGVFVLACNSARIASDSGVPNKGSLAYIDAL